MSKLDDINPRVLALVTLVICAVAFIAVIVGSSTGGDSSGSAPEGGQQGRGDSGGREGTGGQQPGGQGRSTTERAYTVKSGDTLASIAVQVKVPIEKLQQLNPDLDPQALVSGQKIKLRE